MGNFSQRAVTSFATCSFLPSKSVITSLINSAIFTISSFSEASRGDGGGSDTKSACHEGRKGLVGNCVFVCRNVNLIKSGLKLLAGQTAVGKVEEHQVIVGSARHNADTAGHKLAAKHLGVFGDVF